MLPIPITITFKVDAIRNQHPYVSNYVSAKSGISKRKKKYRQRYSNREQYLVVPILFMELIFEFGEDIEWKDPVSVIFSVSPDRNWS